MRAFAVSAAVIAVLILACPPAAGADKPGNYPSRPLEIIVPFAAGGGLDVATRLLAKYAEQELGQNIVVSNKTHGGNIAGNLESTNADPDGYVLGAWGSGLATDELIIRNVPYTHEDVIPLCLFANDPNIIAVSRRFSEDHGIESLRDLVEHVKKHPGLVTIGMGGNWTAHDFMRLKIESMAEVKFNRMPFLGGALAVRAAAEENCNVVVPFLSEILPWLESGRVVPLAVAYDERLPQIPDVPTVAEEGYPGMTQGIWRVLALPKGTPDPIVQYLGHAFRKAFRDPAFKKEARQLGVNPVFMNSRETRDFVQREYEEYAEKTQEWGIRVR